VKQRPQSAEHFFEVVHCTAGLGCATVGVPRAALDRGELALHPAKGNVGAGVLDGKLLVVWRAGERGGVRMRLAPADTFAEARDVLLFDDHVANGEATHESTLFGFGLVVRDAFALVFLATARGVHVLRVNPGGEVSTPSLVLPSDL
jgi:hypothetical protein